MDKAKEAEGKVSEPDEQPLEDLKDKVRDAPPLKNKNDKGAPGDSKKRMEDMMKKQIDKANTNGANKEDQD